MESIRGKGHPVYIADFKVSREKNNGVCYCTLRSMTDSEVIISADLKYVMAAIKERGYELENPIDVLHKVSQFGLYHE